MQRSGLARALLTCAIALVAALFVSTAANAATFNVRSTDDTSDATSRSACDTGGPECTLRAAVDEANAQNTNDVINLEAKRYTVAEVGSDAFEDNNVKGDFDVLNNGPLTINGATSDPRDSVVSGGGLDRVFQVLDNGTLSLSNLTVTDGNSQEADGGGIYLGGETIELTQATSGTLTLTNTKVVNNVAQYGDGGGIGSDCDADITLLNSHVDRNTASNSGGGIDICGDLAATDSTVDGNNSQDGSGG